MLRRFGQYWSGEVNYKKLNFDHDQDDVWEKAAGGVISKTKTEEPKTLTKYHLRMIEMTQMMFGKRRREE